MYFFRSKYYVYEYEWIQLRKLKTLKNHTDNKADKIIMV